MFIYKIMPMTVSQVKKLRRWATCIKQFHFQYTVYVYVYNYIYKIKLYVCIYMNIYMCIYMHIYVRHFFLNVGKTI